MAHSDHMGQVADIRLGDVAKALGRYRPVLAAVGIITVVAIALPGGATTPGSAQTPFDPGFASETTPTEASGAPVVPAPTGGITAAAPVFDVAPSSPTTFSPPGGTFASAAGPLGGGGPSTSPSPSPPGAPGATTPTAPTEGTPTPLRISESLWVTNGAGTPIGEAGVPEGSLPVANRFGDIDKSSYVRLTGTETTLTLTETVEGQRVAAGAAVVQACHSTDGGWAGGTNASFDDAPPVDTAACAIGARAEDGTWTFDLSAFGDPAAVTGFALLPGPEAPLDFQVAFAAAG